MDSHKLGRRIAAYMEKKGITIEELAARTGLEGGLIRAIQTENAYPSLGPLLKIARSLGVRLGTFLDDQITTDPLIVRKADQKDEIGMLRSRNNDVSMKFHSLGRGKTDRHMEPFFIELLPESGRDSLMSSHEGEEFIVVISGQVTATYGNNTYTLNPGDSIYYNSVVPHDVCCCGNQAASIYAVLYIPE
jgi:transcriptional regulator with XRE-family HTH domain